VVNLNVACRLRYIDLQNFSISNFCNVWWYFKDFRLDQADQGPTLSQSLITANLKMKKHTFLRSSNELPNLVAVWWDGAFTCGTVNRI
jgi:hypothetical protein